MTKSGDDDLVLLGQIGAPHGIKGAVRLRCFTEDPKAIVAYGPLRDAAGREYSMTFLGASKGGLIARIDGVGNRNQAEELKGLKLFVPRAAMPAPGEEEYYHADLIGLEARLIDGGILGMIKTVQNFGGDDMLEVARVDQSDTVLIPFTRDIVPQVDVAAGFLVIAPLPGMLGEDIVEDAGR